MFHICSHKPYLSRIFPIVVVVGALPLIMSAKTAPLTKLVKVCGPIPASHGACDSDIYKPVWRKVVADNGEVTKIDIASIAPMNGGGARAIVYTFTPGTRFDPAQMSTLQFDCRGKYQDESGGPAEDAPPRSVVGRVAAIVCGMARR